MTKPRDKPVISKGGIVAGYKKTKKGEQIRILDDDMHALIIGSTRSGKTRSIVLQSIVVQALAGESIVVSDPKSELFDYLYPFLMRLDYEVIALDYRDPKKSHRYNFLQPVIDAFHEGDNALAVEAAWDITEALVGETKGEPIWSNGEKSIVAGSILAVVYDNMKKADYQNLTNVYYFISYMCRTVDDKMPLTAYLKDLDDSHPAKGVYAIAEIAPFRTRASFFTSALTTLRLFTGDNIYTQSRTSDFSLTDCGMKKQAIFIILPDSKTTYYTLASLFVSQHYNALAEYADSLGGRLPRRVNYNLDEFGNFTTISNFAGILTVAAGRGLRFYLYVQGFDMLVEKYGKETAATIKDNTHIWIYLKSTNDETNEAISKRLSTYTTSSYSKSSSHSGGANRSYNASHSMNLISRALLTADEVSRIQRPYMLVMVSGLRPAIAELPDISQWSFNRLLGMGDMEHNRTLRMARQSRRPQRNAQSPLLWKIWEQYSESDVDDVKTKFYAEIKEEKERIIRSQEKRKVIL